MSLITITESSDIYGLTDCYIRCQALHVISNLVQHQPSDKWRRREGKVVGLLWLMRQYTDLLRDVTRSVRGAGARLRDHGCEPLRLWVVRGSHTIHCGEC